MNRVALVTGAARGIGAETVRVLVGRGYRVVALDVCSGIDAPQGVAYDLATAEDLERLGAEHPDDVLTQVADVRDADQLARAVAAGIEAFGRLDAVVAAVRQLD